LPVAARRHAERPGYRLVAAIAALVPYDLPAPSRNPDQIHRVVDEVLQRPEFRPAARPLLDQIWSWLLKGLAALLSGLGTTTAGSIIGVVVLVAILALLALLATRFARTMSRSPEVAAAIAAGPRRDAAEWRAEAEAHEAAGDWRQAVRCRYRALIADLARRGVVDELPGRTSGEYLGEVGRNLPKAAEAFGGATEVFERAWYGRRPTGAGEAASFRELAGSVLERSPR
jgi:predicted lipid-binding transport protein (Tim44 family)